MDDYLNNQSRGYVKNTVANINNTQFDNKKYIQRAAEEVLTLLFMRSNLRMAFEMAYDELKLKYKYNIPGKELVMEASKQDIWDMATEIFQKVQNNIEKYSKYRNAQYELPKKLNDYLN